MTEGKSYVNLFAFVFLSKHLKIRKNVYSISLIVKKVSARDLLAFGRDFTAKNFFCNYTL